MLLDTWHCGILAHVRVSYQTGTAERVACPCHDFDEERFGCHRSFAGNPKHFTFGLAAVAPGWAPYQSHSLESSLHKCGLGSLHARGAMLSHFCWVRVALVPG